MPFFVPDFCAGIETVVSAWLEARDSAQVSWNSVAEIATRSGESTSRRVAYLLRLMGMDDVADLHFEALDGRKTTVTFDRSNGYSLDRSEMNRDSRTGVLENVPVEYLHGWVARR